MPGNIGQDMDSLAALDTALAVASGTTVNGSSKDIGANTSPQATTVAMQFSITNAGSTDGYDLDVYIQFSDDNTNWPDAISDSDATTEGLLLANFFSSTAGADLGLSGIKTFVPKLRYFRAVYLNNNGTDAVTVNSEEATHDIQYS